MKFLFLKPREFEDTVKEMLLKEGQDVEVTAGFSEERNTDILLLKGKEVEEIPLEQVLDRLGKHLNVVIQEYDVTEVGDFGEGYLFRID